MGFFSNSGMANDVFNVSFQRGVEFRCNSAYRLFENCSNFNSPVTIPEYADDCGWMFNNCANFNSNVYMDPYNSLCTRVGGMFNCCPNFSRNFNIPLLAHNAYQLTNSHYSATLHVYSQGYDYAYNGNVGNFHSFFYACEGNFNIAWHTEPINIGFMCYCCNDFNTNINIPTSVRDEHNAFEYCHNLNQNIRLHDRTNAAGCFHGCENLDQNIRIPRLGNISEMFSGCYNLNQSMYVPEVNGNTWEEQRNNIKCLFRSCTNLNSRITLDTNLKSIYGLFEWCSNFNKPVTIPANVVDISYAFGYCPNFVQTVSVPSSVREMEGTFCGCYNLSVFPGVPSGVTSLTKTFSGTNISHITALPDSITSMSSTFENCRSLNDVISLPSSVMMMSSTFKGCGNFNTPIRIPSGVTQLGSCFSYCSNFDQPIDIPTDCAVMSLFSGSMNYRQPVIVNSTNEQWYGEICSNTQVPTLTLQAPSYNYQKMNNLWNVRCDAIHRVIANASPHSIIFNLVLNGSATHPGSSSTDLRYYFEDRGIGPRMMGCPNSYQIPYNYNDYVQNYKNRGRFANYGGISLSWSNNFEDGGMQMVYSDYPNYANAEDYENHTYFIRMKFI